MTPTGPLNDLPIACTLTVGAGRDQVERWRAFDADYLMDTDRTETRLVVHYAKVDDSVQRLRALVDLESDCCSFVDWVIDDNQPDLRLVVTGTPEQLATLNLGNG